MALRPARPLAYTTVMTIMHRLYLKGFLRRSLQSRTHYYEPSVAFADVRDAAVADIIDQFFHGVEIAKGCIFETGEQRPDTFVVLWLGCCTRRTVGSAMKRAIQAKESITAR